MICVSSVGDGSRPRGVASGEAKQMLSLQENKRRWFRFQVALFRFHNKELYVLSISPCERLGYETGDVLVLETLNAGAVHLKDQLTNF